MQESPVKTKARELQLPIFQPATLKDEQARILFRALEPELIVVVAYGKILPKWLLDLPKHGAVNVHGSLLPKYRGAAPIHWAVANGEMETGVCTMQVDQGLDTGPVYLCEKTPIHTEETVAQLSDRLAQMGQSLLLETVRGIVQGRLQPTPQDPEQATLAPILKREHGYIDWNDTAYRIHNHVRAFNPWPATVTRFRGTTCKIIKTRPHQGGFGEPGLIGWDKRVLRVSCGEGILEILELQPENRKPVSGIDFANGARLAAGEKFQPMTDN
jgi:methionyl-tRNA formyltransferase